MTAFSRASTRIGAFVGLAIAVFAILLVVEYDRFKSGEYGFHDLTLICDFFSNAIYRGRPFWVSTMSLNHLTVHFTPTLLLLVPFFLMSQSQFLLVAICCACTALGAFLATLLIYRSLKIDDFYRTLVSCLCLFVFGFNQYSLRIANSGHFEPLFFPLVLLVVLLLLQNKSNLLFYVVVACCLGIRQDAGLFLAAVLLALVLFPQSLFADRRAAQKKIVGGIIFSVLYVVSIVMVVMPRLGYARGTREWSQWGQTWPEVGYRILTSPAKLLQALQESALFDLNREFGFSHVLYVPVWIINQLPGFLFYASSGTDKRQLEFYNASFLLPGIAVSLAAAFILLGSILKKEFRRRIIVLCMMGVMIYLPIRRFASLTEGIHSKVEAINPFADKIVKELMACHDVQSVATDFKSIVFAPLRPEKFLLDRAAEADVVVLLAQPTLFLSGAPSIESLRQSFTDKLKFNLIFSSATFEIFARDVSITARCNLPS